MSILNHASTHIPDEAIHAALLSMAQDNIGADVQGLLMHGFDKLNAKPNALRNALAAALPYLSLSDEPAQGEQCNHITDASKMVDALKETRIDLVILQGNVADAAKTNSNWEEMPARIREWIDRIDAALHAAPTTEAGK